MSSGAAQIAVPARHAAEATAPAVTLDCAGGEQYPMPVHRWLGPVTEADRMMLDACTGATIDIGCGPGRMTAALGQRGVVALGIDISATAVRLARRRGAVALQRNVFDSLPGERRWQHALVADENLGIGGDPVALLRRLGALIGTRGSIVVETQPPGVGWRTGRVRLQRADAGPGPWFGWAWVGADAIAEVAGCADLKVCWTTSYAGRWFAELITALGAR